MTTKTRAKKGGEFSPVNGKFYKGGWFMPTTGQGKKAAPKSTKVKKVEIEPYKWVEARNAYVPIYQKISTFINARLELNQAARDFYQQDISIIQELVTHYKAGYRWIMWNKVTPIVRDNGEWLVA